MTIIEIFALILASIAGIKIFVLLIKPSSWLKVIKKVYAFPELTIFLALVLSLAVLWYLLQELSIVQIFAAILFVALLGVLSFASFSKEMIEFAGKFMAKSAVKKAWLAILIWILLIIWVLYVLFS